jgi:hypothetical protein
LKNSLFSKDIFFSETLASLAEFRPKSLEQPDPWVGHTPFAYWAVQHLQPKVLVELGTHSGNSYFSFCQSILENKLSTKAFAVDTWGGDLHAGFYDESVYESVALENQKYRAFSSLIRSTFDSAVNKFDDRTIDLLHIDGLHTYEAVKHDFETWLPKMSAGGFVFFHDTNVFRDDFGVHKFWSEISRNYSSMELKHCNGLGILQVSPGSKSVIPAEEGLRRAMESFFSGLSSYMLSFYQVKMTNVDRAKLQHQTNLLVSERDALLETQNALVLSLSWKITAPFRLLIRLLRRR